MARSRFSLAMCASSRGSYVARAHQQWLAQQHEETKEVIVNIMKPRYYVRCFGRLIQITEIEAAMLRRTGNVITR